jgi:hypothetical protein
MKWLRSNIRLGSRLALFALAIQFLLSFGHFHGSRAQAAPALVEGKQSALRGTLGFDGALGFAAMNLDAWDRASHASASGPTRSRTSSGDESDGEAIDHCAICAAMALAGAMMVATPPPDLQGPQAAAFLSLAPDPEFVDLNSARVAFQPRAPPLA